MQDLDIDQALELVFNGFTPEHAAAAVAESHGEPRDGEYAEALLAAIDGED